MTDSLEQNLKEAEIAKLNAETKVLKRPFLKPSNWIPVFIAVGGIITAITQWQIAAIKEERITLEAERKLFETEKKLDDKTEKLQQKIRELQDSERRLQEQKSQLKNLAQQEKVQRANLTGILRKIEEAHKLYDQIEVSEKNKEIFNKTKALSNEIFDTICREYLISASERAELQANKVAWDYANENRMLLLKIAKRFKEGMKGFEKSFPSDRVHYLARYIRATNPDVYLISKRTGMDINRLCILLAKTVVGCEHLY